MPFEITEELVRYLMEQNKELLNQNRQLSDNVADLTAQVEVLTKKIAELTEQKNKNSNNSSKPPSSDGLKKPNKNRSLREKTDKKQGGQDGHNGHFLEIIGEPNETKPVIPLRCKGCPNWISCQSNSCSGEKRYVVD